MAQTNVRAQMQQRRDAAANWTSEDPTLLSGEFGYETDTGKFKIGDGSTAWSSLDYLPILDNTGSLDSRFRITSNGRVGIGASDPSSLLHLSANSPQMRFEALDAPTDEKTLTITQNSSGQLVLQGISDTGGGGGAYWVIGRNGNSIENLTTYRAANERIKLDSWNSKITFSNADGYIGTVGSTDLVFETNSSEAARITSGNVYIGATTSPNTAFLNLICGSGIRSLSSDVSGGSTSTRVHFEFSNSNGVVGSISTAGSSTSFSTSSDYRLKENVTAVTDGIIRLQQLKPSRFNFIADPDTTVDGFIAHEVQDIVPEAITGEKDAVDEDGNPEYQGIDQSKLVPLLTAALQEAVAKIESLEARLTAAGI